jgi:hypothetical protein
MEADYNIFEIVKITKDFWLFDAESYQRRYDTANGQPLEPGYYVVNWPEHIRDRRFNEHASFHGPFESRQAAQAAENWMIQMRECVFKIPTETIVSSNRIKIKNIASQKLRPRRSPKVRLNSNSLDSWISGLPVP